MNFLSHIYLSGESEGVITGNFIGDYVKGHSYLSYPPQIMKGILLHRAIDDFTDHHPCFGEAKEVFRQGYGRYSGIVTDVAFDHFLAAHWHDYSNQNLHQFATGIYHILMKNYFQLPLRVKQFLPVMIANRRLESYASARGFEKALALMCNYTSLPAQSRFAFEKLEENRTLLTLLFHTFMGDIMVFVEQQHQVTVRKAHWPGKAGDSPSNDQSKQ